jgi:hypothetical protein
MATFAEIKARVASETDRDDLTAEIERAVLDGVDEHADMNFAFNEDRLTTTTTAGQRTVAFPAGLRKESMVSIDVSGNDYDLKKVSAEYMEDLHNATDTQSQPTYYAFLDGEWHLWPTPGQVYTLTVVGVYDETALSADTDTNGFTDDRTAARMIAAWARAYLARNVTYDEGMEQAALREYVTARNGLTRKTNAKQSTGRLKPCL